MHASTACVSYPHFIGPLWVFAPAFVQLSEAAFFINSLYSATALSRFPMANFHSSWQMALSSPNPKRWAPHMSPAATLNAPPIIMREGAVCHGILKEST